MANRIQNFEEFLNLDGSKGSISNKLREHFSSPSTSDYPFISKMDLSDSSSVLDRIYLADFLMVLSISGRLSFPINELLPMLEKITKCIRIECKKKAPEQEKIVRGILNLKFEKFAIFLACNIAKGIEENQKGSKGKQKISGRLYEELLELPVDEAINSLYYSFSKISLKMNFEISDISRFMTEIDDMNDIIDKNTLSGGLLHGNVLN